MIVVIIWNNLDQSWNDLKKTAIPYNLLSVNIKLQKHVNGTLMLNSCIFCDFSVNPWQKLFKIVSRITSIDLALAFQVNQIKYHFGLLHIRRFDGSPMVTLPHHRIGELQVYCRVNIYCPLWSAERCLHETSECLSIISLQAAPCGFTRFDEKRWNCW